MLLLKLLLCQEYKIVTVRILFDRQIKLKEGEDNVTFGDPDVIFKNTEGNGQRNQAN